MAGYYTEATIPVEPCDTSEDVSTPIQTSETCETPTNSSPLPSTSHRRRQRISSESNDQTISDPSKKDKPHRCNICSKNFDDKYEFIKHYKLHSPEKPHKCPICAKQYKYFTLLTKHMPIHDKGPNTCEVCHHTFANAKILIAHGNMHKRDPKIYTCESCGKTFKTHHTLLDHQANHVKCTSETGTPIFTNQSGISSSVTRRKPSSLSPEKLVPSTSGVHREEMGDEKLEESSPVTSKLDKNEGSSSKPSSKSSPKKRKSGKTNTCSLCPESFNTVKQLEAHVALHNKAPYECEECKEQFATFWSLRFHSWTHFDVCICDLCNKPFKDCYTLLAHRDTHSKKKPSRCSMCHKTITPETFEAHIKCHAQRKPFPIPPQQNVTPVSFPPPDQSNISSEEIERMIESLSGCHDEAMTLMTPPETTECLPVPPEVHSRNLLAEEFVTGISEHCPEATPKQSQCQNLEESMWPSVKSNQGNKNPLGELQGMVTKVPVYRRKASTARTSPHKPPKCIQNQVLKGLLGAPAMSNVDNTNLLSGGLESMVTSITDYSVEAATSIAPQETVGLEGTYIEIGEELQYHPAISNINLSTERLECMDTSMSDYYGEAATRTAVQEMSEEIANQNIAEWQYPPVMYNVDNMNISTERLECMDTSMSEYYGEATTSIALHETSEELNQNLGKWQCSPVTSNLDNMYFSSEDLDHLMSSISGCQGETSSQIAPYGTSSDAYTENMAWQGPSVISNLNVRNPSSGRLSPSLLMPLTNLQDYNPDSIHLLVPATPIQETIETQSSSDSDNLTML